MVLDGVPRGFAGAPGPSFLEIPRDILDNKVPLERRGHPGEPSSYRASTRRASATPTTSSGSPRSSSTPSARACCSAARCGPRAGTEQAIEFVRDAEHPGVHERRRPRHAAAGRPAPLPPDPPLRVQQRRRDPDRRHAVRLPDGLRQAPVARGDQVIQIDMDYRTVGKNRDITLGLVGDPGRDPRPRSPRPPRAAANGARQRKGWLDELRAEEKRLNEKRLPRLMKDTRADPPAAPRARDQRVPHRGHASTSATAATSSRSPAQRRPAQGPRPVDGPGPARHASASACRSASAPSRPTPTRRSCACSATARSASPAWTSRPPCASTCRSSASSATTRYMNQIRYGQIQKYGEDRGDIGNKLSATSATASSPRCSAATARRSREPEDIRPALERAARERQAVADQRVGGPERLRARDHEPDDVQVGEGIAWLWRRHSTASASST